MFKILQYFRDSNSLCQRLKQGLNKWMNKDARIAKYFSFDVSFAINGPTLIQLDFNYGFF